MYKKLLFYLMLFDCVCRGCAMVVLPLLGEIHIPLFLFLPSAAVTILGIVLVIQYIRHGLRLNQLALFHCCTIAAVIFSLTTLWFWPTDVSIIETLITGSLLNILFSGTLLVLAYQKKHYITVKQRAKEALSQESSTEKIPSAPKTGQGDSHKKVPKK